MLKFRTVFYILGIYLLPSIFVFSHSQVPDKKGNPDHERGEVWCEFIDSLSIGKPGQNKIILRKYMTEEELYDELLFYKRENNRWVLQNREIITDTSLTSSEEQILDYNNDGYNDFSYMPSISARGINVLSYLYVYSPETNSLQYIKKSIDYPNLAYNKKLDCLDSYAVYGGSTTWFLKLQGDSLSRLADVTLFDKERTLTVYDTYGKEIILLNDTLGNPDCVYLRFSDYELTKVLEEYQSYCFE